MNKNEQQNQLHKTKVWESLLKLLLEFGRCCLCKTKSTFGAAAKIKATLSPSRKQ